jgi:hypothetical protein
MFGKQIFRGDFWLMGKGRYIIASSMVVLILLGVTQMFIPVGDGQENTVEHDYWLSLATDAWQYYQPGAGVNAQTGLHGAGLYWPYFTEWDLGTYIQAIVDAHELGILQKTKDWGFDYRVEKILSFLKTRELTSNQIPFLNYDSRTGKPYGDVPSFQVDEGKLYMALYNLKCVRPDLTQDIDYIVKVRNNNTAFISPNDLLGSTDFYNYYVASAFKAFDLEGWAVVPSAIMGGIFSQSNVTTYGIKLPSAHICTEPLLLFAFEVNQQDSRFSLLLSQVYLANEARYNATGHYTAFSEGNTDLDNPNYVYEFVVDWDRSTWKVAPSITPIAYFKVAVGFHALFNTEYTRNMVNYIKGKIPAPSNGFQDGVAEDGRVVGTTIDRTNGLIISAARYAISKLSAPSITPTPTTTIINPTPTPTPTETLSPSPSPSPLPSSSFIPTSSPSSSYISYPSYSPYPSKSFAPPVTPSSTSSPSSSLSPSFSPSPTSSPSSTSSPLETPTSSPTSIPSLSPNVSPCESSSPTANTSSPWSIETVVIVVSAVVGCSLLGFLVLVRLKRIDQRN